MELEKGEIQSGSYPSFSGFKCFYHEPSSAYEIEFSTPFLFLFLEKVAYGSLIWNFPVLAAVQGEKTFFRPRLTFFFPRSGVEVSHCDVITCVNPFTSHSFSCFYYKLSKAYDSFDSQNSVVAAKLETCTLIRFQWFILVRVTSPTAAVIILTRRLSSNHTATLACKTCYPVGL